MSTFHVTAKNYRCFEDTTPLRFSIQDGFIALVGPNNSGKSSCLKLFYEFRSIWESIQNSQHLAVLNTGVYSRAFAYTGVFDNDEIYFDGNQRNLSLEISLDISQDENTASTVSKIEFLCNRSTWFINLYIGNKHTKLPSSVLSGHSNYSLIDSTSKAIYNCHEFLELFKDLASSIYIGPFRNAISEGSGEYFDLSIGTEFIKQWNQWKTGSSKKQNTLIEDITEDIRNIFEFKTLQINTSQQLKTLQFIINGKPYKLKELGAGIAQFVIVLGNIAIKKPTYLLIDEPELNLHPSLQLDFITTIASYTEKSVIYATHSIGLARSSADLIYSFIRKHGKTIVNPMENQKNYIEYLGEMSFSSYREMGFESILFVEGVNDVKTVQQFLRKLKKDHKVVILPLGGDQLAAGGREQELSELKRISNNISVLVDSERTAPNQNLPNKRQDFIHLCEKLEFNYCATDRRAIENYLSDEAIKSVIGNNYNALAPYEKLSECGNPWNKTENWKIARSMDISDLENTDIGEFLSNI